MNNLTVTEYKNIRVLTTQQIADAYGTDSKTISYNFNHNKGRYKEGKHFILLDGEELRAFREIHDLPSNLNRLYLWTEKGAFLHAKSLNNDIAWDVYDRLVDNYFNKDQNEIPKDYPTALRAYADALERKQELEEKNKFLLTENERMKPKEEFFDAATDSKDAIDIGQVAKVLNFPGIGRNKLFEILRNNGILKQNNEPYQKYIDCGYFRVIEQKYEARPGEIRINIKTLVFQKGVDYIRKILDKVA
jgi:phage antirepressor YoqD-like protein